MLETEASGPWKPLLNHAMSEVECRKALLAEYLRSADLDNLRLRLLAQGFPFDRLDGAVERVQAFIEQRVDDLLPTIRKNMALTARG